MILQGRRDALINCIGCIRPASVLCAFAGRLKAAVLAAVCEEPSRRGFVVVDDLAFDGFAE
jgi:hypothetical protein